MQGRIKILMLCLVIFLVCVCGFIKFKENKDIKESFKATIKEINNNNFLVVPFEDEDEYRSSNQISFSMDGATINIEEYKIGDVIEIEYSGRIMESYPARIIPYKIKKIESK